MADKNGFQKAWADPKARKGILLSAGVLGVVMVVTFSMMSSEKKKAITPQAPANAAVAAVPKGERDVTAKTDDKYKSMVAEIDAERSKQAESNATAVVMPTLTGLPDDNAEEKAKKAAEERGRQAALKQAQTAEKPMKTSAQAAGAGAKPPPTPEEMARASIEYKSAMGILNMARASDGVQGTFTTIYAPVVKNDVAVEGRQPAGNAAGNTTRSPNNRADANVSSGNSNTTVLNGNSSAGLQQVEERPIIRIGEIQFATTDIAMSSDYSGPVTATIHQGPHRGARLIGTKNLERDALVVKFTQLSPADGSPAISINAYAVSLGDARAFGLTGLEGGETEYHIFQRYILPAAASFVQSYGMSAGNKGSSTTVSNGTVIQSEDGLTAEDRRQIALGAALTPITNDILRNSSRPITVSMPAHTEIGVMFAADVMAKGMTALGAQNAAAYANSPSPVQSYTPQNLGNRQDSYTRGYNNLQGMNTTGLNGNVYVPNRYSNNVGGYQ